MYDAYTITPYTRRRWYKNANVLLKISKYANARKYIDSTGILTPQ